MNSKVVFACLATASLLGLAPVVATADPPAAIDRAEPIVVVKDSAITSAIKAGLEAEPVRVLQHVHVDTDDNGVVTLKGHVRTQDAADRAISIAKATDGVREVRSAIEIKIDD